MAFLPGIEKKKFQPISKDEFNAIINNAIFYNQDKEGSELDTFKDFTNFDSSTELSKDLKPWKGDCYVLRKPYSCYDDKVIQRDFIYSIESKNKNMTILCDNEVVETIIGEEKIIFNPPLVQMLNPRFTFLGVDYISWGFFGTYMSRARSSNPNEVRIFHKQKYKIVDGHYVLIKDDGKEHFLPKYNFDNNMTILHCT